MPQCPRNSRPLLRRCVRPGWRRWRIASVPEFAGNAATLATQAIASRLPAVCEWDWMAREGCLLGYGPDFTELRRRTADYVIQIFRGASPGELPMQQPTH